MPFVVRLRTGGVVQVGDAHVTCEEARGGGVKLIIAAPPEVLIRIKTPGRPPLAGRVADTKAKAKRRAG